MPPPAIAPIAILLAQLIGMGFACGFNLYATVALLGLGSRLGWFTDLPLGLRGLENGVIIGSAAILYVVEFVVDKIPYADSFWDAVHTTIRPLAAVLLALLALSAAPLDLRVAGAALTGIAALAAHSSKAGLRVALNTRPRPALTTTVSLIDDAAAVALTFAALRRPLIMLPAVLLLVLLMSIGGPGLWRAAALGVHATVAWLRGFFGDPGWRVPAQLPRRFRTLLRTEELGGGPPRATRAALLGFRSAGAYRNGWLVFERQGQCFLYHSLLRPRRLELPPAATTRVRKGVLADIIELQAAHVQFKLFLLKDGPPTEVAIAEIGAHES
jgi:hypothetical protein